MHHGPARKKKLAVSPSEQRRALFLILFIVCVPLLGTVAVVVSSGDPDLADLAPRKQSAGDSLVLDWSDLRRDHPHAMIAASGSRAFTGAEVQAFGYMADAGRAVAKGEQVGNFVLLPESGNLLHPAHRFGDQMIAVNLREGERAAFSPMRLVRVSGIFRASPGDPAGPEPLYALEQAHAQPADKAEIHKYFAIRP